MILAGVLATVHQFLLSLVVLLVDKVLDLELELHQGLAMHQLPDKVEALVVPQQGQEDLPLLDKVLELDQVKLRVGVLQVKELAQDLLLLKFLQLYVL